MRAPAGVLVLVAFAFALAALAPHAAIASSGADPSPGPTTTLTPSVTVTIPSTASPSPSPSGATGGGGGGGGGGASPEPDPVPTAPAIPSKPTAGASRLELDEDRIEAGDSLTATGSGFTPGEQVQFVMYSSPVVIGSFTAGPDGFVVAEFETEDDLRPGGHTVEATGWQSERVANASFVVISAAGTGSSIFPWIVWLIVAVVLALAIIGVSIAGARGWLPFRFRGVRVTP